MKMGERKGGQVEKSLEYVIVLLGILKESQGIIY